MSFPRSLAQGAPRGPVRQEFLVRDSSFSGPRREKLGLLASLLGGEPKNQPEERQEGKSVQPTELSVLDTDGERGSSGVENTA